MTRVFLLVCGLAGVVQAKPADLPTPGPVVNIVEWDGNELPAVYERSDQLPIGPTDLISAPAGLSVVVVAVPLPCGEKLTRVSIEVWDGYVVIQRSRGKRIVEKLGDTDRDN